MSFEKLSLSSAISNDFRVHQAIGFVIAQADVSADAAADLLCRYARSHARELTEVAIDVVKQRISFAR